ncbi:MAG: tetratricopeptide repeat protein [Methylacidiphilales bacterium]|nr:tetratricopeptide repeat protein [Candidatus Methylacidiphilales bacterium]
MPQPEQPSATGSPDNPDPAKVAEYQRRFQEGYALEQEGKLVEARTIYDGILAEDPKAKRSLLEAGRISYKLNELEKADNYLERLHEIVPDFPEAIELLIQINQALKRDVRVELLVRDFGELRDSGRVPALSQSLCFRREVIHSDPQTIVISQFFNYTQDPNTVWMAEVFDTGGKLQRRVLLNFDPETTRALRAKDDKYADIQVFTWLEHVIKNQKVTAINAYLQIFALPDYQKFRNAMLVILANPPKPIYSMPVGATQQ